MTQFTGIVFAADHKAVDKLLAPYDESRKVKPYPVKLAEVDVAIMQKLYRTTDIIQLRDFMDDWIQCKGLIVDNELHYMCSDNANAKWNWYEIREEWHNIILPLDANEVKLVIVTKDGWLDYTTEFLEQHADDTGYVVDFNI